MRPKPAFALLRALALVLAGAPPALADDGRAPVHGYEVVASWPHDPEAFTQGLFYERGRLYESTGRYGASSLRLVELESGKVLRRRDLPARYFGEGSTALDGKIFLLTWRSRTGFVYARDTFAPLGTFVYTGEGWGLTTDGQRLILSDGTSVLRFLDPRTLRVTRTVAVHDGERAIADLNELEYVQGEIWANVWGTDLIARIDPDSGRVRSWVDLAGLYRAESADAVLNGIAYDAAGERLFVTGKLWPRLFHIRVLPAERREPQ